MVSACILHNYCIDKNVYDFPEYNDIDYIDVYDEPNIPNCEVGIDRRMQLFNEIFPIE